ncbi:VOC family protein [Candidatus Saccharibacteria bacterium]|nr:MAG: VOC family protein [Candidatus Saccharibacteria bacterium]
MLQKITPNLWFDGNAREAAEFYVSVFPGSKIAGGSKYPESKEEGLADFQLDLAGKDLTVDFNLAGHDFVGINAGPEFKPTPALSFMVNFDPSHDDQAKEHLDEVWGKLLDGGEALMELGEYPFSKWYGWVKDRYGFTWQLMLTNPDGEERPCIIPNLMFANDNANKAEEAIDFYLSVFKDSKIGTVARYEQDQEPVKAGGIMFADFNLAGEWFAAMDAPGTHEFGFNEAVSLSVVCKDQAEIDDLWSKLSAVPESEQCGWCKDKYGVSWQIVPENMAELMNKPDAFAKMMQMHKIVIADFN